MAEAAAAEEERKHQSHCPHGSPGCPGPSTREDLMLWEEHQHRLKIANLHKGVFTQQSYQAIFGKLTKDAYHCVQNI